MSDDILEPVYSEKKIVRTASGVMYLGETDHEKTVRDIWWEKHFKELDHAQKYRDKGNSRRGPRPIGLRGDGIHGVKV